MNEGQTLASIMWAMWFSTALAVGAGLYFTHDMRCLWFMIIPAFMSIGARVRKEDNNARS